MDAIVLGTIVLFFSLGVILLGSLCFMVLEGE